MNKLLLIGGLIIALASCSDDASTKNAAPNTTPNVQAKNIGELKIAYYNQDSLKMNYSSWVEADSISKVREQQYQKELQRKYQDLENYRARKGKEQQQGLLSVPDLEKAAKTIQNKEQAIMSYEQNEGMKIQQELSDLLTTLQNKMNVYGEEFCTANNIDILLVHGNGGQFGFIHSSMNVTSEFTAFLNLKQSESLK